MQLKVPVCTSCVHLCKFIVSSARGTSNFIVSYRVSGAQSAHDSKSKMKARQSGAKKKLEEVVSKTSRLQSTACDTKEAKARGKQKNQKDSDSEATSNTMQF